MPATDAPRATDLPGPAGRRPHPPGGFLLFLSRMFYFCAGSRSSAKPRSRREPVVYSRRIRTVTGSLSPLRPHWNRKAGEETNMHTDVHVSVLLDAKTVAMILWVVTAYLRRRQTE